MATINISGHTGWRRAAAPSTNNDDGIARFTKLKSICYDAWHAARKNALAAGLDPQATVQLIFSDKLDNFSSIVAPMDFILRRSRTRPLLMQYQISLMVLNDNIGGNVVPTIPAAPSKNLPSTQASALASIGTSISTITSLANQANTFIKSNIAQPVAQFMFQTAGIFSAVQSAYSATGAVANSLIAVAQLSAQAGVNIFRSLAAIEQFPTFAEATLLQVVGAYTNAFCVLTNVLGAQAIYPDYSPLYGSSNCSSTSGGTPPSALAGLNPFDYVYPAGSSGPTVITPIAQTQLKAAAAIDPVLAPPTSTTIGNMSGTIANGITVPLP
jgi:hypothetical protein